MCLHQKVYHGSVYQFMLVISEKVKKKKITSIAVTRTLWLVESGI